MKDNFEDIQIFFAEICEYFNKISPKFGNFKWNMVKDGNQQNAIKGIFSGGRKCLENIQIIHLKGKCIKSAWIKFPFFVLCFWATDGTQQSKPTVKQSNRVHKLSPHPILK